MRKLKLRRTKNKTRTNTWNTRKPRRLSRYIIFHGETKYEQRPKQHTSTRNFSTCTNFYFQHTNNSLVKRSFNIGRVVALKNSVNIAQCTHCNAKCLIQIRKYQKWAARKVEHKHTHSNNGIIPFYQFDRELLFLCSTQFVEYPAAVECSQWNKNKYSINKALPVSLISKFIREVKQNHFLCASPCIILMVAKDPIS